MALLAPVGTYDKVNLGETTLTNNKGSISIMPNQMGFVGGIDQMPQLQPLNLKLFSVVPAPVAHDKGGMNNGGIRDHAVVDNILQEQDGAVPFGTSVMQVHSLTMGSVSSTNFMLQPVTATVTTTTTSATTGLSNTTTKLLNLL